MQPLDVAAAVDESEQPGGARGRKPERVVKLAAVGSPRSFAVAIAAPNGPTALVGWKPRWRKSGAQARASVIAVS